MSILPEYHLWGRPNPLKLPSVKNSGLGIKPAIFWTFGKPESRNSSLHYAPDATPHRAKTQPLPPKIPFTLPTLFSRGSALGLAWQPPLPAFHWRGLAAMPGEGIQNLSATVLFCWIRCSADLRQWCAYRSVRVLGELGRRLRVRIDFFQICQVSCWLAAFLALPSGEGKTPAADDLLNVTLLIQFWQLLLLPPLTSHCFPEIKGPHPAVTRYQFWMW